MKTTICLLAMAGVMAGKGASVAVEDAMTRFWRENDGKTVRRLPVQVLPENVFWSFSSRDFADGMKTFSRMAEESFARSTYNCITLTLRCNPELGDPETQSAAKSCIEKAHAAGVKVYMDTDPRIARREFFRHWPEDRQGIAQVVTGTPGPDGVAAFETKFTFRNDHMSWGSQSSYRPMNGRVASARAVRRNAQGNYDFAHSREVEVEATAPVRTWADTDAYGHMDHSEVTVRGTAAGLASNETLVVVAVAEYNSIDVFSPHLIPFSRSLMERYKALGADGGMRDEWGFIPNYNPDMHSFFFSPHLATAYRTRTGRDLLADIPLLALGAKGDAVRSAAIGDFMKLTLARNVEIERDFHETDKRLFGDDVYVCKHPTWFSSICPQEFFHNGLDWWQAPRDWAQGDEITPMAALNGMAKKAGGPVWLNEGYTATPERNVFRVWTYAMCGGRQVYHGLYSGSAAAMKKYTDMPWEESRVRRANDLLAPGNVTAQARIRLQNLVTRAQVDSPVAFVFGHENLVDWSGPGWKDYGADIIFSLQSRGWWSDLYPASECALGTFTVDAEGWVRVGRQRYTALVLYRLSAAERAAFDQVVQGGVLKTKIFERGNADDVAAYLDAVGAVRQPIVKKETKAGPHYPEPDGALYLQDGTVVRIRADWEHPCGLPIMETLASKGVQAAVEAEGVCVFRSDGGIATAFAAGGLRRVSAPGLELELEHPEDIVVLKIDGAWHGVWQTRNPAAELPKALAALTPHWIRLVRP